MRDKGLFGSQREDENSFGIESTRGASSGVVGYGLTESEIGLENRSNSGKTRKLLSALLLGRDPEAAAAPEGGGGRMLACLHLGAGRHAGRVETLCGRAPSAPQRPLMPPPVARLLLAALIVLGTVLHCSASANNASSSTQNVQNKRERLCRTRDATLPPHLFAQHTCALCYTFMMPAAFTHKARPLGLHLNGVLKLLPMGANETVFADAGDANNPLLSTFSSDLAKKKWLECCDNARLCCDEMLANTNEPPSQGWCPRTWDGWLCWGDSPPLKEQFASCPTFIALTSEPPSCMQASKICLEDGTWYRLDAGDGNVEWTNYSTCSTVQGHQNRAYISVSSFGVSVIALVPALIIFSIYRYSIDSAPHS
ncbi:Hypothetical predicted protein [Cloeon dipterum]|uniref:G-protein coupled receptors family 2 profile 1 domain-containing protein n=1 Tax=Cloeon dipterum TaxID=197152 RepID=A0A8S1D7Z4_9INSE|nr:Hypothetical predicted protein [Cloeon dipterum]